MSEKFGEFDWKCWKDEKPEDGYIYIFHADHPDWGVEIVTTYDTIFDDFTHWCYVFIPDPPKIEKRKLEPCNQLRDCSNNYILALEDRIEKLEEKLSLVIKKLAELYKIEGNEI